MQVEAQPRARGAVRLTAKAVGGATKLDRLRQQGALKLILPTLFRDDLEAVLVNTSGGVTGGDELSVEVTAREGTTVSVTTQAAERLYRAQPGECARISNRVDVEAGARLNWLPQETILFDRCSARRTLDVELAVGAAFLMVESLIFGRAAMGEVLRAADFNDRIAIRRTGVPVYLDGVDLRGDVARQMMAPACGAGAQAVSSIVLVHPQAAAFLAPLRAMLPFAAGASLIAEDVLVMRVVAADGFALRETLVPVLMLLNETLLPKSWRL